MAFVAIKTGKLIRLPCEICGAPKTDAHHDDYAKPLEIRWLCRSHHREHHAKFGAALNDFNADEVA
jgi:sterol desaturase/sphingolipid hydroxylase (fatty acid hydroxylase superfamily)